MSYPRILAKSAALVTASSLFIALAWMLLISVFVVA